MRTGRRWRTKDLVIALRGIGFFLLLAMLETTSPGGTAAVLVLPILGGHVLLECVLLFEGEEVFGKFLSALSIFALDTCLASALALILGNFGLTYYLILLLNVLTASVTGVRWAPTLASLGAAAIFGFATLHGQSGLSTASSSFWLREGFFVVVGGFLALIVRDVEQERQAGEAERLALGAEAASLERYLEEVLQGVNAGVLALNAKGHIDLFNVRAGEIFAIDPLEVLGRSILDLGPLAPLVPVWQEFLAGGPAAVPLESARGEQVLHWRVFLSRMPPGGAVLMIEDETDLRDVLDRLAEQERLAATGLLARGVAHEFRNLLGGLRGHADLALQEGDASAQREALELVQRNLSRALRVVDDLQTFGRGGVVAPTPCAPARLVAEAVYLVREEAEQAGVSIEVSDEAAPEFQGDPFQVQQVLLNLLLNGIQAMSDGGRLRIACRGGDGAVVFTIDDDGAGVPSEVRTRIFRPFYTTKGALGGSRVPGTGLGLSVSMGIVRAHGGDLRAEVAPGGGARFVCELPLGGSTEPPPAREGA